MVWAYRQGCWGNQLEGPKPPSEEVIELDLELSVA